MTDATLFHSFFDHLPGMAFQVQLGNNDTLHCNYISPGSAAVLDIDAADLTLHPQLMLDRIHAEDKERFLTSLRQAIFDVAPWNWEGRIVLAKNKEVKWVNLRATCRKNSNLVTILEGFMVNITQSKQSALEIMHAHQQLHELSSYIETFKEQERSRIARQIHDDIGVLLTAVKMDLSWLTLQLPREQVALHEKSRAMSQLLDTAVDTVNNLIHTLRPGVLDHFGIAAAIDSETKDFSRRSGITCKVIATDDDLELSDEHATSLFRTFQEILNNIMLRSGGHSVRIKLYEEDDCVTLQVSDDGQGYNEAEHLKQRELGLRIVKLRVSHLGGCSNVEYGPDRGIVITVSLPLADCSCEDCNNYQPTLF